ncbi:FxsA family protein [Brachybacterium paraconglomeratum]|uniref:FxsA family protein n=1 Tax=Brachybacterium paraconglomeratum TaxID=173362 RepID=UPI0021A892E0|nr:FxsA family protein [Brachybacterium paraconglomeratum]MCT1907979.1 FxsA family protein [Brachybacterium paraconglomeratum]
MTSSPHSTPGASGRPTDPADRRRSRRASAIPLAIVVVGLLELAILVLIGVNTSLWWSVLIVVVGWLVGVALLVAAGQQSFVRVRSLFRAVRGSGDVQDHLSRPAFTMLSALLFFFPGLLTDLAALVLLLTPVQKRAVSAMGLGSGSEQARTVLYRRSGNGVIDGEIIVENRRTGGASGGTDGQREDGAVPPMIVQDPPSPE